MKRLINMALVLLLLGCSPKEQADGWYLITDPETMTPDKTPIVSVADFETLRIDSVLQPSTDSRFPGQSVYSITGNVRADKKKAYADATEKYIGRQMGFLYKGEVIMVPQVNARIESGMFAITPPSFMNDRKRMMQLYEDLHKEIKH